MKHQGKLRSIKERIPFPIKKILMRMRDFYYWDSYHQKTWSQDGEDIILSRFFDEKKSGFYVDVGAHHPFRFSNTYKFYCMGWKGINLDAMPGSMKEFNKHRSRDINLEIPVSLESKILEYYIFNEPALNGFDASLAQQRNEAQNKYKIIKKIPLKTQRLSDILDECLPPGQEIDFLSIDVEGLDFEVIKSNNWDKYRPKMVLVEILFSTLSNLERDALAVFLIDMGYQLYAKSVNTVFFKNAD